jgi:ribosome-associated heat shock protein Hsp15
VLTFSQGKTVRVVRVLALGLRRGSAVEAQTLFEEVGAAPSLGLSSEI